MCDTNQQILQVKIFSKRSLYVHKTWFFLDNRNKVSRTSFVPLRVTLMTTDNFSWIECLVDWYYLAYKYERLHPHPSFSNHFTNVGLMQTVSDSEIRICDFGSNFDYVCCLHFHINAHKKEMKANLLPPPRIKQQNILLSFGY